MDSVNYVLLDGVWQLIVHGEMICTWMSEELIGRWYVITYIIIVVLYLLLIAS